MAIYHVGYTITPHPCCSTNFITSVNHIRNDFRNIMEASNVLYTDETLFYISYEAPLAHLMADLKHLFDELLNKYRHHFKDTILNDSNTCSIHRDICEVNLRQNPLEFSMERVWKLPIL